MMLFYVEAQFAFLLLTFMSLFEKNDQKINSKLWSQENRETLRKLTHREITSFDSKKVRLTFYPQSSIQELV